MYIFNILISSFIIIIAAKNCTNLFGNCISFSVSSNTGCQWMCTYCANSLGTNNYYFTDQVCTYQNGGCIGNPQLGKTYTCCSV